MELIRPGSTFDCVGKRHGFLVASAMINLQSTLLILTWGLSYGLDFTGGAMVAVAHTILVMVYHMLKAKQPYRELGADYVDRLNTDHLKRMPL